MGDAATIDAVLGGGALDAAGAAVIDAGLEIVAIVVAECSSRACQLTSSIDAAVASGAIATAASAVHGVGEKVRAVSGAAILEGKGASRNTDSINATETLKTGVAAGTTMLAVPVEIGANLNTAIHTRNKVGSFLADLPANTFVTN